MSARNTAGRLSIEDSKSVTAHKAAVGKGERWFEITEYDVFIMGRNSKCSLCDRQRAIHIGEAVVVVHAAGTCDGIRTCISMCTSNTTGRFGVEVSESVAPHKAAVLQAECGFSTTINDGWIIGCNGEHDLCNRQCSIDINEIVIVVRTTGTCDGVYACIRMSSWNTASGFGIEVSEGIACDKATVLDRKAWIGFSIDDGFINGCHGERDLRDRQCSIHVSEVIGVVQTSRADNGVNACIRMRTSDSTGGLGIEISEGVTSYKATIRDTEWGFSLSIRDGLRIRHYDQHRSNGHANCNEVRQIAIVEHYVETVRAAITRRWGISYYFGCSGTADNSSPIGGWRWNAPVQRRGGVIYIRGIEYQVKGQRRTILRHGHIYWIAFRDHRWIVDRGDRDYKSMIGAERNTSIGRTSIISNGCIEVCAAVGIRSRGISEIAAGRVDGGHDREQSRIGVGDYSDPHHLTRLIRRAGWDVRCPTWYGLWTSIFVHRLIGTLCVCWVIVNRSNCDREGLRYAEVNTAIGCASTIQHSHCEGGCAVGIVCRSVS